jgi:hypothetical protein
MHPRVERRIFDRLRRVERRKSSTSVGLVTDDSPFTVLIGGTTVEVSYLDSYTPTIFDKVLILHTRGDAVVLGKIA